MTDFTQIALAQMGLAYTPSTVTLTSAQASGTDSILPANANRRGLKLMAAADFQVAIASGATVGLQAFGGLPFERAGPETPTNAIYVIGLTTGAVVTVWEA